MKKLLALTLTLGLLLVGCTKTAVVPTPTLTPFPTVTPEPTPTATPVPDVSIAPAADRAEVNFAVLSGPSGVGAAALMAMDDITLNDYDVTIAAANDQVVAGLTGGDFDVAAVASNVAANLYNKTNGDIQAVAVSGLGVLYILENGDSVQTLADLAGKTIYATGQGANPEFVLNYLLEEADVDLETVDIQWKAPDEITALMVSGQAEICMMPVPAATAIMMKNTDIREAIDLSAAWDATNNGSRLTMTTLVARTAFINENPDVIADFLEDYNASVLYMNSEEQADEAAQLVADFGLAPSVAIAKAALPKCNLVCITGQNEMLGAIQGYYEILWQADPASIGGGIPDDGFYYG